MAINIEYYDMEYKCYFCNHKFKQKVGKRVKMGENTVSDKVKCPNCNNFIKTWE